MLRKMLAFVTALMLVAPHPAIAKNCKASTVRYVAPPYPPVAATASVSGVVYVLVTIDADGGVTEARLRSGHKLLNDAALKAAREWKFAPCAQLRQAQLVFRFEIGKAGETGVRLEPLYKAPFTVIVKAPYPQDNVQ